MTQNTVATNVPAKRLELSLGEDGIAYVRHALEMGTSLSEQVLQTAFSGGTAYASVPEGNDLARAKQFEWGGLKNCSGTWTWLQAQVKEWCTADPQSTFVVEDPWGGRYGDSGVMRETEKRKFFHGEFVYYFVEHTNLSDKAIEQTIRSPAFLFIGFFSRYPLSSTMLPSDLKVDDQLIRDLAENTRRIVVGAYDQEGWGVWQR